MINWTDQIRQPGTIASGNGAPSGNPGIDQALYTDLLTGDIWGWYEDSAQWVKVRNGPRVGTPIAAHRFGLTAADAPNYPVLWVPNSGYFENAKIVVAGATYAPTDTNVILTLDVWTRSPGDVGVRVASFTAQAQELATPYIQDTVPPTTFLADRLIDAAQNALFLSARPALGSPSNYIITAHTPAKTDPAFYAWAASDVITNALIVQKGHLPGSPVGWNGGTPDGTVTVYSVALPNLTGGALQAGLAGNDVAVTLRSIAGLAGGTFDCDISVQLF